LLTALFSIQIYIVSHFLELIINAEQPKSFSIVEKLKTKKQQNKLIGLSDKENIQRSDIFPS
jgi:hypothetical protein